MFVAIYRWKVAPGLEERFERAWSTITSMYIEQWRSGGSALLRAHDGMYVGIARWQNREARARAFEAGPINSEASAELRAAVLTTFEDLELECIDDQWVFPMPAV